MANETKARIINDDNFDQTLQTNQPVLIDFWATWCRPCQAMSPVIDELAQETAGQFVIGKLDIDSNPDMPTKYNVKSIPTLIIFKEGKEVERLMGIQAKAALQEKLAAHAG
ncbi:MAG: thioredoxin [Bacteroidota bacterium]